MEAPELVQFDHFDATFEPQRTDDLKPKARPWVGKRFTWEAMWVIENGCYEGQWACGVYIRLEGATDTNVPPPPFSWAPDGDLVDREVVDG